MRRPAWAPGCECGGSCSDCFTTNEVLTYEALGLCGEGEAEKFIWDSNNHLYGGKWVTNPSGGLLSKGHPAGRHRSGPVHQLSQQCVVRRVSVVPNARVALQHNLGLGGAAVLTMYQRG